MKSKVMAVAMLCLPLACASPRRDDVQTPVVRPAPMPTVPQTAPTPQGEPPPFIFAYGEFKNRGCFAWTNGMTLKDGIEAADGFSDFASRRLRIYHRDGSEERYRLGPGRTLTNNPILRMGDKVMCPPVDW
jgi:hypothetical protein